MIRVDGKLKKIKGKFEHFNFSSHSGSKQLFEMIDGIKGSPTIVAVHGEEEQSTSFVEKIQKDFKTLSSLKMRREATETLLKKNNFEIPSKMEASNKLLVPITLVLMASNGFSSHMSICFIAAA